MIEGRCYGGPKHDRMLKDASSFVCVPVTVGQQDSWSSLDPRYFPAGPVRYEYGYYCWSRSLGLWVWVEQDDIPHASGMLR